MAPFTISRQFYSKKDLIEITGQSLSTIDRGLRNGKIPFVKIPGGKNVLIPASFIEALEVRARALPTEGAAV